MALSGNAEKLMCPCCKQVVAAVERIGSLGAALQTLRPATASEAQAHARRAADAQRAADSRGDARSAVAESATTHADANTAAMRALRVQMDTAVGSRGAALWLTRELISLVDGRPLHAALPVRQARLPHRLVQPLLARVEAPVHFPRYATALRRVREHVPQIPDGRPRRKRLASVSQPAWPVEVDALVQTLIGYKALC